MFKPGQAVLYKPTDIDDKVYKTQAGIIKRMSNDGKNAFVWYHSGCTAARTPLEYLEATPKLIEHALIHTGCVECCSDNREYS